MGWDVVEIGLRHNLPVEDPIATAKEVAKRLNRNIMLVKYKENEYMNLGEFKVNESSELTDKWTRLTIADRKYDFELYELEDDGIYIRIFQENVDLSVSVIERWFMWESAFHDDHLRNWLNDYRMQIYNRAKQFGCSEVIICSDQGPTMEIFDRLNWPSDKLKEYTQSFRYVKDQSYFDNVEYWKKDARQIMFADYFAGKLIFGKDEFVDVVFDDFKDLQ